MRERAKYTPYRLGTVRINPELCVRCRGEYYLCGLSYCPLLTRLRVRRVIGNVEGRTNVDGSSPPSVFVGRANYPKVPVYPSTPPIHGDTRDLEEPSKWVNRDLEDYLAMRLSMVRGMVRFRVSDARDPPRVLHDIQTMALSQGPVDSELRLTKPLRANVVLSEEAPPFGPSAPLDSMKLSSMPPPSRVVEKAYSDVDLNATEAIWTLYRSGVDVSHISRLLSVGALGVGYRRRLVPTRWSITAVDKAVSDRLVEEVKAYDTIDEYRVYARSIKDNLFVAILAPHRWMFEWGEAWWPGSTWNQWGREPVVEVDWEGYGGRDEYPSIGGCYYAARLATAEALYRMRRQAAAILWREIYGGFNIPVGVWWVRENVRAMFSGPYERFDTLKDALSYVAKLLRVPLEGWVAKSGLVKRLGNLDMSSFINPA